MRYLALIVFGFLLAVPCVAQKLPLPSKVMDAKTVFIDNQSGSASIGDRAYSNIKKWGRFTVVFNPNDADLVVLLTAHEYVSGYRASGSTTVIPGTTTAISNSTSSAVAGGTTYLALIDPQTGNPLWRNERRWGRFKSATHGLLNELKDRIKEQEKPVSR